MKRGIEEVGDKKALLRRAHDLLTLRDFEGAISIALEGLEIYKSWKFVPILSFCGRRMDSFPSTYTNTESARASFFLGYAKYENEFGYKSEKWKICKDHLQDAIDQGHAFSAHFLAQNLCACDEKINLLMKSITMGNEDAIYSLRDVFLCECLMDISEGVLYRACLFLRKHGHTVWKESDTHPYSQWEPEKHCQMLQSPHTHEEQKTMLLIANRDKRLKPLNILILRYISAKN